MPVPPTPNPPTTITLVAAVARNGTIGSDGGLPWHLPADLQHFKALTMGRCMVMGRRTFESIGRALPGRRTIVVTRDRTWSAAGVAVTHSVPEALDLALGHADRADSGAREVMVVGGGEIYRQTIERADRLEITHVDAEVDGDTQFPEIDPAVWHEVAREPGNGFTFVSYRRDRLVSELRTLLSSLAPELHEGEFVFCTVPPVAAIPEAIRPVCTVSEREGTTLVVTSAEAAAAGLSSTFRCSWITLTVDSALDAVGLTAAVATVLAGDGIACNMVAGFHHDHLFVPVAATQQAMAALAALAHTRS